MRKLAFGIVAAATLLTAAAPAMRKLASTRDRAV